MNDTIFLSLNDSKAPGFSKLPPESGRKWKINDITKYKGKSANTSDFKENVGVIFLRGCRVILQWPFI